MRSIILAVILGLAGPAFAQPTPTDCLARAVCAIKDKIRWRTPAWKPEMCQRVADAARAAGAKHQIDPVLLVSLGVNESELQEGASRAETLSTGLLARDGGLMGIRCITNPKARDPRRCMNGFVAGMRWKDVIRPETNIELAAAYLAQIREGVPILTTVKRHGRPVREVRPCLHRNHWMLAHYNWGMRADVKGASRHYPHRVAVLYHAMTQAMDLPEPALAGAVFVQSKGARPRLVDKPVGLRQKRLYAQILGCSGVCSTLALAPPAPSAVASNP